MTHAPDDDDPGPNEVVRARRHGAATSDTVEMGSGTEFDLIRDLWVKVNPAAGAGADVGSHAPGGGGVWLGAGDDAAVIDAGRLVMSTDLSVEDVHFRRSWVTFAEAGARAVTAAASDLAAMAAAPVAVLISLAVAPQEAQAVLSRTRRRDQDGVEGARRALGGWRPRRVSRAGRHRRNGRRGGGGARYAKRRTPRGRALGHGRAGRECRSGARLARRCRARPGPSDVLRPAYGPDQRGTLAGRPSANTGHDRSLRWLGGRCWTPGCGVRCANRTRPATRSGPPQSPRAGRAVPGDFGRAGHVGRGGL